MVVTKEINDLSNVLSAMQLQEVNDFVSAATDWEKISHGEKRKLQEGITVVFLKANGTNDYKNILEAHKKFYDLHYTVEGRDCIVSKLVANCKHIRTDYVDEGDYILYNEEPVETAQVSAGNFCLIPPADAHMALYGDCGFVKKLVFKIPVSA